ncbi:MULTISPECIES: IS66-like element accessory protein TnpA [unclassified Marinovum]
MRGEILGLERRRRWSDEEKLGIVMSVGIDNATVTQVAQRHDVTRQQIYAWRHDLKKKGLLPPESGVLFLAVDIPPAHRVPAISEASPGAEPKPVELRLRSGRCLRFDSNMDAALLTLLIRAVEAA